MSAHQLTDSMINTRWAVDDKQKTGPRTLEEVLSWVEDNFIAAPGYEFVIKDGAVNHMPKRN